MSKIAVITVRGDVHVPLVERHSAQPFVILDPLKLLADPSCLSIEMSNGEPTRIVYDDIDLSDITAIWFRKPAFPQPKDIPFNEEYREYAANALERLFYLLYGALKNVRWMSDYYAIQRANDKGWQLQVAKELGFRIPDTLFTSDPSDAAKFINQHDDVIMKPLSAVRIMGDTQPRTMFAVKVHKSRMPRLDTLRLSPLIFQAAIDVAFELRCTVVGDTVFAAKIVHPENTEPKDSIRDWRMGHFDDNLDISAYEDFPKDIQAKCVAHVKALGLSYGAIDMIVDKNNEYWFIENNPNGQWGFVERITGQPIGKAIADFLQVA